MKTDQGEDPNDDDEKKMRVRTPREGAGQKTANEEETQLAMKHVRSGKPIPISTIEEAAKEAWCEDGRRIVAAALLGVDVTKTFSPERTTRVCERFGLIPSAALADKWFGP